MRIIGLFRWTLNDISYCVGNFFKKSSLKPINNILRGKAVDQRLIIIAMRNSPLIPYPPPGSDQIVVSRDL